MGVGVGGGYLVVGEVGVRLVGKSWCVVCGGCAVAGCVSTGWPMTLAACTTDRTEPNQAKPNQTKPTSNHPTTPTPTYVRAMARDMRV